MKEIYLFSRGKWKRMFDFSCVREREREADRRINREMKRAREVISYDLQNEQFSNQLSRQEAAWTKTGRQARRLEFSNHTGMERYSFARK